jgi:hypothetical protein
LDDKEIINFWFIAIKIEINDAQNYFV